jgi:hypothetical protein
MPSFSNQALDILIEEPPELSKLYMCLLSIMCHDTFIAGITYTINHAFLRERLSVSTVNGRKGSTPTPQKIRSTLPRMQKIDLLVNQGKNVFYLPFEARHHSVQKRYNTRLTEATTEFLNGKTVTYTDLKTSNNTRYNLHLYNNNNNSDSRESPKKPALCDNLRLEDSTRQELTPAFAMDLDWQCNRDLIKKYLDKRGDDPRPIDVDWMVEYQGYWLAKPHIQRTQVEWDIDLANYLSQFIRNPERFDELNGFLDSN